MSRQNKVNPDHYKLAGRLSPDDLARERRRQMESQPGPLGRRIRKPMPPWAAANTATGSDRAVHEDAGEAKATTEKSTAAPRGRSRAAPKSASAKPTPRTRKAAGVRTSSTRSGSSRRVSRPAARKSVSPGRQKVATSKGKKR